MIRPLLHYSRAQLEQYAQEHTLQWIDDDSNADTKFNRNYLRHDIFPILKKRFPACMENFARSARLMAEQEKVISEIVKKDLKFLEFADTDTDTDTTTQLISVKKLLQFSESRQRLILREWFRQNHLRMPNEKQLKQIQKDVLNAAPDAHPIFKLESTVLRRVSGVLMMGCL